MNTIPGKSLASLVLAVLSPFASLAKESDADLCIYGATSAGIATAIQASRMGDKVVLLETGSHLGGLTTGGLGATDIGNKAAIGGISREFYERIAKHYSQDSAWTIEKRSEYFAKKGSGQLSASDLGAPNATMWTFEPHVAEVIFKGMLNESGIRVVYNQHLAAVKKDGVAIREISMRNGDIYRARMFVDATYEGDLMAMAEVSFHVGREANSQYGETLNGIRPQTPSHQFTVPVDPYVKPGDPASGLLPFIQPGDGGKPGDGDARVQTYNYRLCFTTNASLRMELAPPPGYDPARYELLARYLEGLVAAGKKPQLKEFWNPIWMPNGKTDINNNGGFSTDFIGANYDYPNGDEATRARIRREHENYTRGFITFMATSPRVPAHIRAEMQQWGPATDEFQDTAGWPNQMYVREARRMVSDYVMTEHNCRGMVKAEDSVGLGAYNMDSHNCQRIVRNGHVENEGDVQVAVKPYPISYRSIVPKASQCDNLFVPVCLASTHIAYGSIRMEPVFMMLGQSAATAAHIALVEKVPVQKVNYKKLRARLVADKQVLDWKPESPATPPQKTRTTR
ncbi:MAG: Xanthan lyase [Verrucomicrobiales bacterium]|nr:Xanthan lyase [Verrucomicrobiales bacterium]